MSITDKANIRPSNNNVILQTFKKPVLAFCILILNKVKGDWNYLLVAINSDCRQYCSLIFPCQESAVNTQNRKAVNEWPYRCSMQKKARSRMFGPPDKLSTLYVSKALPRFLCTIASSIRGRLSYEAS